MVLFSPLFKKQTDNQCEALLHDPVFTGGEVVFGGVDEGNPEVEHEIEEEGTSVLGQEHLQNKEIGRASCRERV